MPSSIDAAITGLVGLLQAAPALSGVTVHDGPPMTTDAPWIAVGYQPEASDAVVIEYDWAQLGAGKQKEKYDILCSLLIAPNGDGVMSTARRSAADLRDAIGAVLFQNRELGVPESGIWLAQMTSSSLLQEQGPKGALVGYKFTVTVQARITS